MKLFNSFTAAAVLLSTTFLVAIPAKAEGCYPALASMIIEQVINGGGSAQQGWEAARQEGNWDGNEVCTYRVRSYLR